MERRKFRREFKIEAVRLIRERGVSVAQAARDLDLHENMLRRWVKEMSGDLRVTALYRDTCARRRTRLAHDLGTI